MKLSSFQPPVLLESFKFVSGNAEHPSDRLCLFIQLFLSSIFLCFRFLNTTCEVQLEDSAKAASVTRLLKLKDDFFTVGVHLIISSCLVISYHLYSSYNIIFILSYLIISFHIILRWGVLTPQAWRRVWWGPRWGRWRSSGWQLTPPARTGPFSVKYSSRKQRDSSSRVPLDTQWDISQECHTMVPQMIIVTNVQWESSL